MRQRIIRLNSVRSGGSRSGQRRRGKTLITGHTHRPMNQYPDSFYINSGSCVHPYQITCLELEGDEISLVNGIWMQEKRKSVCGEEIAVAADGAETEKRDSLLVTTTTSW